MPLPSATNVNLRRLLTVIADEILPKTEQGVASGNKVFGAAVLRRDNLATVVADTNHETTCPLFHGEVYVIQRWSELSGTATVSPADAVFLSTHEPCCMCISAIVWAGFKTVFYLFPYEATRDQGIPHDIEIMNELWNVERYQPHNKFCHVSGIKELVEDVEDPTEKESLLSQIALIERKYADLSLKYHTEKSDNDANTLAFD